MTLHRSADLAGPTTAGERAPLLDALRGFALFGVCAANLIVAFSHYGLPRGPAVASLPTAATDPAAAFLLDALVDGKFYSLFSLLFGIGFALQLQRAESRGEGMYRYARRLFVLLIIGLAHLLLLWSGDILALYALVGFVLIVLRKLSSRALLIVAAILLVLPVADYGAYWLTDGGWSPAAPIYDAAQSMAQSRRAELGAPRGRFNVAMSEDWRVFFAANQAGLVRRTASLVEQVRPAKVLALFLVGVWIGRRRLFAAGPSESGQGLDASAPFLRRVAIVGLGAGLPLNVLLAWLMERKVMYGGPPDFAASALGVVQVLTYALGVAPLAIGYAAAFALAWRTARGRRVLGVFAPAGRMALTNYIVQTVIGIALFYGVGLDLAGQVGPTLLWLLAAVIIAVQCAYSALWLRYFRFGPLEWLWRTLTYGRMQPMRGVPATVPVAA